MKTIHFYVFVFICLLFVSCRNNEPTPPMVKQPINGFYLLNEGTWGSNNASLDMYDYETSEYTQNVFSSINPEVILGLGDVGNDLQIYGSKIYAVINASNIVEVMDAATAKHIAQIEIPNCRKIIFYQGKAYVSSYAGVVLEDNTQLGYVAEIDTSSFLINRTISVGYQPEGMAAVDGKLYVANSGGYLYPVYDNKLSIIDIETFTEVSCVEVAVNMQIVEADSRGNIIIVSWGNDNDVQSDLILFDTKSASVKKRFNIRAGSMCIVGDSAYVGNYDYLTNQSSYTLVNLASEELVPGSFIAEGYESIVLRSIAVNPDNHDIFLMDAADYVSPGSVYCFSSEGEFKWREITGNTPGYIAFKKKTQL